MNILALLFYLFLGQYMPYPGAVNNTAGGTPGSPFVTGQTIGTLRNNFTGCVGFSTTVGAAPITVTDLGRWITAGNSGSHTVDFVQVTGGVTLKAQATINTSGATANAFAYANVGQVVIAAGTLAYVVSTETNGGDQWADNNTILTHTSDATVNQAVVATVAPNCVATNGGNASTNNSYVPVDFKYHL